MHPNSTRPKEAAMRRWLLSLSFLVAAVPSALALPPLPDPIRIERTGKPNDALIGPPGECAGEVDRPAPVFAVSPQELFRIWTEVVLEEPRTRLVARNSHRLLLNAEQLSRVFGFVDEIAIRVLPAGDGGATFVAYSKSRVGYYDFGVNRARLERWIDRIQTTGAVARNQDDVRTSQTARQRGLR
jgi:uncharacterized protein (DUF1499 family)